MYLTEFLIFALHIIFYNRIKKPRLQQQPQQQPQQQLQHQPQQQPQQKPQKQPQPRAKQQ